MNVATKLAVLGMAVTVAGGAEAQRVKPVPVFVNGGRLENDAMLLQNVGRSVLPMRTLFESLGARVEWDPRQRAVYAWKPDRNGIRLGLGERSAQQIRMDRAPGPGNWGRVVGSQSLDAPAMMVDGRIYVPLRFASEALSADVRYASNEPAVYIRTEDVAGSRENFEPRPPRRDPPPRRDDEDLDRPRDIVDALDVTLEVDRPRGDREAGTRFRMTVRNRSNHAVRLPFRSGQRFDFEVLQEGKLIWNWARDRAFTQALTSMTLAADEETVFQGRWDYRDNQGRRVEPGRYLVRGIVTTAFQRPQIMAEERIDVR